ncbi:zinc finger protein 595 isoform X12 [Helicoverpa armigera]|uniref:zinc finger protein 595 isoform X12 n=1 Tax=Helicoverpa armigera TaxID=29058 RepID=UPI0030827B88
MDAKTSEWRAGPNVCRCCLTEGCYKDISTEYFWMGKREVYAEMLADTLNVSISYSQSGGPNSNSRLICELCISRLRDASDFKRQVLECEKSFTQHLDAGASNILELDVTVEPADSDVKLEHVKQEKRLSDDDDDFDDRCGFDDDDDDDLDDQPLTKLATKIPKKETVDILDLLDNSKATEKRKSSTKTKAVPAKKTKSVKKEPVKAGASKVVAKTDKKKKGNSSIPETSIWQLTVRERKNAATFIQLTTVRPFIFMGSRFRCFFCSEYHSEITTLLEHTTTHKIGDKEEIFEKYVIKGKKSIQVDISVLKCRLCGEKYSNLNTLRGHLETKHGTRFYSASNGMTEYSMELVNNMFKCHICDTEFLNFTLLNSHMNCHIGKVVCETCGAGFLNQHLLNKHKECHLTSLFSCKHCDKTFLKYGQLRYHTDIVHKGKNRIQYKKCEKCSETFREHYTKMVHLRKVHGITKMFPCHICKRNFTTRRASTEHWTRIHTEKFKCEICSKCFGIESALKQHIRGHTGERSFECPICKNAFMHKKTMTKHMRRCHQPVVKHEANIQDQNDYENQVKQWHPPFGQIG